MAITAFTKHPIFEGVKRLLVAGISPIEILPGNWTNTRVLMRQNNYNLWALYVSDPLPSPEKTTLPGGAVMSSPVFNPANGHWYRSVVVPDDTTWTEANRVARTLTYQGWRGHLATISSAEENRFLVEKCSEALAAGCWLGGFQDKQASDYREPDGGWRWVTGERWEYSNWNRGLYQEPNDGLGGHEDFLGFTSDGRWNDLPDVRTDRMRGYIVEFEKGS